MSAVDLVHKAAPGQREDHCGRCGQRIRQVPGGNGPVWVHRDGIVAAPNPDPPRAWAYGLTADEWLHLAAEGEASEVAPCCGNISDIRELLNTLATFQSPDGDLGWRRSVGRHLLEQLDWDGDGDGHELQDEERFPLLHRVVAGIRAELADPRL